MRPSDLVKAIQGITNVIAKMSNPYVSVLVGNLIIDIFTLATFTMYRHIWIWIPALIFWVASALMYLYFALTKPHMLSHVEIQKTGMLLDHNMGDKDETFPENVLDKLPSQNDSTPTAIGAKKHGKIKDV